MSRKLGKRRRKAVFEALEPTFRMTKGGRCQEGLKALGGPEKTGWALRWFFGAWLACGLIKLLGLYCNRNQAVILIEARYVLRYLC